MAKAKKIVSEEPMAIVLTDEQKRLMKQSVQDAVENDIPLTIHDKLEESKHLKRDVVATGDDAVNHPEHYHPGTYEAINVIEAWNLGFCLGNAVKYISRAGHKGDVVQDLEKAIWYIRREIKNRITVRSDE